MNKCLIPISVAALILGCSTATPPTKTEQALFDIRTNTYPVIVVQTNTVLLTNSVTKIIEITNQVGIVVPQFVTNTVTIPVPMLVTSVVQTQDYTFTPKTNGLPAVASGVAGTVGNLVAPGIGGPIAGAIVPFGLAIWAWFRGSKKSATANNLAQTIETAREIIKSLPNGAAIDNQFTAWMQSHQAEAGVIPQVLDILNTTVDNQAAKETADQLKAALAALQTPRPPGV